MSKTVDERVVEMRFDNAQFEKNVQTSMSTLDKLKQKLNLSGAAKGLKEIDASAKKVDMSVLGSGVESISAKFSALQVMGVTALANITNSAINAGKNIVSALTIDPVKTGFQEYETQINAVQTILANTSSKGTTLDQVNAALDELNHYADKTIYNFTEMTRNIGTFTAAGVDLETSVSAIQGIANLAAVSGSNSQQASTAMYQLSQAISTGTVKLMDWNSVVNAGMGGEVFQSALKKTSELLGTGAEAAIKAKGSFRESLQTGWLTSEVLTQTLKKMTTSGANEYVAEYTGLSVDAVEAALKDAEAKYGEADAIEEASKALAKKSGKNVDEIEETLQMAKTAEDAATKVKTFTQLIDTLKEAIQSGWTQTWEILIGDFEESKELFTEISDTLGGFINKMAESRNAVLENSMTSNWDKLIKKINEAGVDTDTFNEKVKEIAEDGGVNVDKLIAKYGSLEKAFQNGAISSDILTKALKETTSVNGKLSSDVFELAKNIDEIGGRQHIIDGFKNAFKGLTSICRAVGKAWESVFPPSSVEERSETILKMTESFQNLTKKLIPNKKTLDNITKTFKGLFALLDIITTITGGGLKLAFKGLSAILGAFDMSVLDLTANLGDMIVKFRDFLFDNKFINNGLDALASGVETAAEALQDLYETIKDLPEVQEFFEKLNDIDLSEIGENVIKGFEKGLKDGITSIPGILIEIGKELLSAIKGVLGIHSPSTEMYDVGKYSIEGLINGLKDGAKDVWDTLSDIGSKFLEKIKEFDWSKAFALGVSITLLATVKKMVGVLDNITAPLAGVGDVLSGVGKVLSTSAKSISKVINNFALIEKGFAKNLNARAFQTRAEAIQKLSISLAILAGSVYLLAQLNTKKLRIAVGAIIALSAVLVVLAIAMDKLSSASMVFDGKDKTFKASGIKTSLLSLGVVLLLMAAVVKMIGSMDTDQYTQGMFGLIGLVAAIALVFAAFGQLVKGKSAKHIHKAGKMLKSMAISLLIMVGVCKLVGKLSLEEILKGAGFIAAFLVFVKYLVKITKMDEKEQIAKLSGLLLSISISMALMIGVCKLVGSLSSEDIKKGAAFAIAFLVFVKFLVKITKVDEGSEVAKLGGLLLSISISMALMVGVCKLVGKLSPKEMFKGAIFAIAFLKFIKAMVKATKIGEEEQIAKMAGTLMAMSIAIGIMAGVCILLGLISLPALAKGVAAVSVLGLVLSKMIEATKGAEDIKGSIMAMSVAIAVMAVAVAALSFIDPTKLAGATAALSILMGMFALIAKASSSLSNDALGPLIVMTIMIGVLSGVIYLLSKIPIEDALGATAALSVLLLSLSLSCVILSKVSRVSPAALITAGVLTLVVSALAGILYLIRGMDPASAIGNAKALSLLVLALSAACVILSLAALTTPMALVSAAVMTLVVDALAGILYKIKDMNPAAALMNATALSTLLLALSASCLILAVAGVMGPAALIGVAAMVKLVTAVGRLMTALGALTTYFPKLEEFLDKGLGILEKIGYGLGSFFGNVVSGFADGATSDLPEIAKNLSLFAMGLMPFISIAKQVDDSALSGIKSLVEMIAMISGANFIESIVSKFTGTSSMDTFADQLKSFGNAIVSFSKTVKDKIDEDAVKAAASAGTIMADMSKSLPGTRGVLQFFAGEKDMGEFGRQLVAFGNCIVEFSKTVKDKIDEDAVKAAASAGKIMTEMQKSIVPSDGVVQFFTGEKDFSTFGLRLVTFGNCIVEFSKTVKDKIDEDAVKDAANAGKIMTEMQKSIVPTGAVINVFTGDKDIGTFGTQIQLFGEALTEFSNNTKIDEDAVKAAANAGTIMASIQEAIPENSWFDGKISIDSFGKDIKKFGKYLVKYGEEVASLNAYAINASIYPARSLAYLAAYIGESNIENLDKFSKIKSIGTAMKKYSDEVKDIDEDAVVGSARSAIELKAIIDSLSGMKTDGISNFKVDSIGRNLKTYSESISRMNHNAVASSITSAKKLVSLINSMSGMNTNGVSSFKSAVDTLASTNVSGVVKAFSGSNSDLSSVGLSMSNSLTKGFKSNQKSLTSAASSMVGSIQKTITGKASIFNSAGKLLGSNLEKGLESKKSDITSAARSMVSSCSSALRNYYSSFYSAGSYLVTGFCNGIGDNSFKAKLKARAMALAAYNAAREALDINSPSKLLGKQIEESSYGMAKTAFKGTENTLSKLANLIDNDIDVQPTIRPVVDLSDVKNGANSISRMFNRDSMIGVTADVNAIKSSISNRGQNGFNDDVVTAINKLRGDLSKLDKPSYTINGITYDDGSNVTSAVEALVRAARIERRV